MKFTALLFLIGITQISFSQQSTLKQAVWRGELHRLDSVIVPFTFETKKVAGKWSITLRNAAEKIVAKEIVVTADSVNFSMPVFESSFQTAIQKDGSLKGIWLKGTATKTQQWVFTAFPAKPRFAASTIKPRHNLSGRWAVTFIRP
ncbi:MAG: hypothetical protein H7Y31_10700, partial [Chitinophagaceae bacterium]|nr:hypothetical protein [Chitinophagaceae bacterium]